MVTYPNAHSNYLKQNSTSEWGHDFRKSYRSIGPILRDHQVLKDIPILALTATAIPRVKKDILASLRMKNPSIIEQSFDRPNLVISVKRKPNGGFKTALKHLVSTMKESMSNKSQKVGGESSIIYCPTKNQVDEVSSWLSSQFHDEPAIHVQPYHSGLTNENRSDAHINFLTGKTTIIVATIAFGMGIGKFRIPAIFSRRP